MVADLPELVVPDAGAWREWLAQHHTTSPGVALVLSRKGGTATSLVIGEAVDQALCFGWIDGQLIPRDASSYRVRFTPRRPRSGWSARNVANVERLTAAGLMHPAGLAAVDQAKADGRWDDAYQGAATAVPPPEFFAALAAVPAAAEAWDRLNRSNRYVVYYQIHTARRPTTRQRRIDRFVAMLARGEAPFAQRGFRAAGRRGSARAGDSTE